MTLDLNIAIINQIWQTKYREESLGEEGGGIYGKDF